MKFKLKFETGEPNITTMQQMDAYCKKKKRAAMFKSGRLYGIVDKNYRMEEN